MPDARTDPFANPSRHVTQSELAERWRFSPRTLERWRCVGNGPA